MMNNTGSATAPRNAPRTGEQKQLRELTRRLLGRINDHGPRSEEVRTFILENGRVEGFEDIALMIVLLAEEKAESRAEGNLAAGS